MNCIRIYTVLGFILMRSVIVSAQKDTVQRISDIEIIKTFKPTLTDAIKIPVNPNPETPVIAKPEVHLTPVDYVFQTPATIYTIRPLSTGNALLPRLKNNFTRIGYGNYNSPYAEFYLNTVRNKSSNAGIYVKHFSANPDEKLKNFSDNQMQAYGRRYLGNGTLSGIVAWQRNVYNLYGWADSLRKDIRDESPYKHVYQSVDMRASYDSKTTDSASIAYKISGAYSYFGNAPMMQEHDFKAGLELSKSYEGVFYELKTSLEMNQTYYKTYLYDRTLFQFNPRATLPGENYTIHAGLNLCLLGDSAGGKEKTFNVLPELTAEYQAIPEKLTLFGGLQSKYYMNTFRSIAQENPFLAVGKDSSVAYLLKSLPLLNTRNKIEFLAGLRGHLGNATQVEASVSIANYSNLLLYRIQTASIEQAPIYDEHTVTLTKYQASLFHQFSDAFRFGIRGVYYDYSMGEIPRAYGRSNIEADMQAAYQLAQKMGIRLNILYYGERTFLDAQSQEKKQNPISDINLGFDYRYSKTVSAFIQLNNLTNQTYQRWLNYPVYGINLLAGLTMSF